MLDGENGNMENNLNLKLITFIYGVAKDQNRTGGLASC